MDREVAIANVKMLLATVRDAPPDEVLFLILNRECGLHYLAIKPVVFDWSDTRTAVVWIRIDVRQTCPVKIVRATAKAVIRNVLTPNVDAPVHLGS